MEGKDIVKIHVVLQRIANQKVRGDIVGRFDLIGPIKPKSEGESKGEIDLLLTKFVEDEDVNLDILKRYIRVIAKKELYSYVFCFHRVMKRGSLSYFQCEASCSFEEVPVEFEAMLKLIDK